MKKVSIEFDDQLIEDECVLKVKGPSLQAEKLLVLVQKELDLQVKRQELIFYQAGRQIYPHVDEILFFQTQEGKVWAHEKVEAAVTNAKLYELEEILPSNFIRISKSGIVNVEKIYAMSKRLSSSLIEFRDSQKQIYASRRYLSALEAKMEKGFFYE